MNQRVLVVAAAALCVLGGGAAAFRVARPRSSAATVPAPATPPSPAATSAPQDSALASRTKGSPEAPVTVLEIADFQCPACRIFWEQTMPYLQREYVESGKVRFVFLNLPLVSIHHNAAAAAQFAMCAARQDRFWPIHDALFEHQAAWAALPDPSAYFFSLAAGAGLQTNALGSCVADTALRTAIATEAEGLVRRGVRSTPSFVIEGGLLEGAAPIESWRPILDSIYNAKAGR
jgi:protein-disulfide isomerase